MTYDLQFGGYRALRSGDQLLRPLSRSPTPRAPRCACLSPSVPRSAHLLISPRGIYLSWSHGLHPGLNLGLNHGLNLGLNLGLNQVEPQRPTRLDSRTFGEEELRQTEESHRQKETHHAKHVDKRTETSVEGVKGTR